LTKEQPTQGKPWISVSITAVLLALTVQDQLSSGSVDWPLLAVDVVLVAFWMGRPIDALLERLSR
jgi:hypothetical protein